MFRGLQNFLSIATLTSLTFSFFVIGGNRRVSAEAPESAVSDSQLTPTDYGKLPLLFEQNKGQADAAVKFISRGAGYTLYLREDGAEFSLKIPTESDVSSSELKGTSHEKLRSDRLKMTFEGADQVPTISGDEIA